MYSNWSESLVFGVARSINETRSKSEFRGFMIEFYSVTE